MDDNIASVKVLEKMGLTFLKAFDFDGEEGVIYEIRATRRKVKIFDKTHW